MSTVRVYRSTDPGAPAHPNSTRGTMAALLRACLVTGYGSGDSWSDPAGWEEPYEEVNHCACFRALSGTARMFYQVDDLNYDADVTRMTMYDSMSDAETGIGSRGGVYFGKWYNATESKSWWVIADETTCYVVLDAQDNYLAHGFGEYQSLIDDDTCPAFIAGHNMSTALADDYSNCPLHNARTINSTTWHSGYIRRSISSAEHSSFSVLNLGVDDGSGIGQKETFFTTAKQTGVSWLHLPLIIKAVDDAAAGINLPVGLLRGLRQILASDTGTIEAGDSTLFVVAVDAGANQAGRIAIDITGSWD